MLFLDRHEQLKLHALKSVINVMVIEANQVRHQPLAKYATAEEKSGEQREVYLVNLSI